MNYTISNSAGGNERAFRWTMNGLSITALQHAVACGPDPIFGGEAGSLASEDYDEVYNQYLDGDCGDYITSIFEGAE